MCYVLVEVKYGDYVLYSIGTCSDVVRCLGVLYSLGVCGTISRVFDRTVTGDGSIGVTIYASYMLIIYDDYVDRTCSVGDRILGTYAR